MSLEQRAAELDEARRLRIIKSDSIDVEKYLHSNDVTIKVKQARDFLDSIKEINNYKWVTDKDGNKLNKPVDMFNHSLDAVRYVALNKLKTNKSGVYNISIVGKDGDLSRISTGQSQLKTYIR